jgi:hypothetical protein
MIYISDDLFTLTFDSTGMAGMTLATGGLCKLVRILVFKLQPQRSGTIKKIVPLKNSPAESSSAQAWIVDLDLFWFDPQ